MPIKKISYRRKPVCGITDAVAEAATAVPLLFCFCFCAVAVVRVTVVATKRAVIAVI